MDAAIDKQADDQRIEYRNHGSFGRGGYTAVNAAKDNDRA